MKRKVSKLKKHNFCNTDNSEAAATFSTKKATPKNLVIPTGKHPLRSLSLINLQALKHETLSKRDVKTRPSPHTRIPQNPKEHSF